MARGERRMGLAGAIAQTMRVRGLTTSTVAGRLGETQDRATFYRMLNGSTMEPRLVTLVRLCMALETSPTELLELAGLWAAGAPGGATAEDLRLRGAFARVGALPLDGKRGAVPLVAALAAAWGVVDAPEEEAAPPADASEEED